MYLCKNITNTIYIVYRVEAQIMADGISNLDYAMLCRVRGGPWSQWVRLRDSGAITL